MNLKNYTSEVPASKSMGLITEMLVEIGASNINMQYKDKVCVGITFLIFDSKVNQTIPFHLKVRSEECFNILWKQIKKPIEGTRERLIEQANRTSWKILSDWVQIQCSMIMLGQAEPLQMFLPFVYDVKNDETFYDKVVNGKAQLMLTTG